MTFFPRIYNFSQAERKNMPEAEREELEREYREFWGPETIAPSQRDRSLELDYEEERRDGWSLEKRSDSI